MVKADAEELCEWVDIICQAFLTVVVIYLLFAYAIGQRKTINIRLISVISTLSIVSPISSGVLKKIKQISSKG